MKRQGRKYYFLESTPLCSTSQKNSFERIFNGLALIGVDVFQRDEQRAVIVEKINLSMQMMC
jgi:hypothetical protein